MSRRGSCTNAALTLAALIIGLGTVGYMLWVPTPFVNSAEAYVKQTQATTKAKTLQEYMEDQYMDDALNWSLYQTTFEFGNNTEPDIKNWGLDGVPSIGEIESAVEDEATEDFRNKYLGDATVRENCAVESANIGWDVTHRYADGIDIDGFNYSVAAQNPVTVKCSSDKGESRFYLAPWKPDRFHRDRIFDLANISYTVALSAGLNSILAQSAVRSSQYAVATQTQTAGVVTGSNHRYLTGGANIPYQQWSEVEESFENEQEPKVAQEVEDFLSAYIQGQYLPGQTGRFASLDSSMVLEDVDVDIEYEVTEKSLVSDYTIDEKNNAWIVSNCRGSCNKKNENKQKSCIADSESCDADVPSVDVPSCHGNGDSDYCSTSSFDWHKERKPSEEGLDSDFDIWTDNPWKISGSETHEDSDDHSKRVSYSGPTIGGNSRVSVLRPFHVVRRSHSSKDCADPPTCPADEEPCYDIECEVAHNHNQVVQQTRKVWVINRLRSVVDARITFKDTAYRIPTSKGYRHPRFSFDVRARYTGRYTEGGFQDIVSGNGPGVLFGCPQADYYHIRGACD